MAVDPEAPQSCDEGCSTCCKQQFQRKNFLLNYYDNRHFVHFQCGGSVLVYWIWRLIWALYHVVWIILTGVYSWQWAGHDPAQQIKWFIYLTDWCYFMLTLSTLVDFVCVTYVNWMDQNVRNGMTLQTPWYLKANWVLFNIGNAASITVSLLYWILLYSSSEEMTAVNIETHALNSVYVILNLFVTAFPVRLLHFFHGMIYAFVYVMFSLIYQLAGGTNEKNKNYIYSVIDWDNTGFTVGISIAVTFAGMPLIHALIFGIYKLRVCMFNMCCRAGTNTNYGIDNEALELSNKPVPQYN